MGALAAITTLLMYQLAGEVISRLFHLPVPGPVMGMALLFLTLLRRGLSSPLRETSLNLLQHLSLLFVPAGVGVMVHFNRLADEWLPITAALLVSTLVTLAASAWAIRLLQRKEGR